MAISVNHVTKVISIPKADTIFVSTNATTGYEIRSYDEYVLMREMADYLDSEDGAALPNALTHATQVTISGVVYARALSILAPYTVTFENGVYQVKLVGGTNNNLLDVLNPNNVSVIPANSAGLQQVTLAGGSGLDAGQDAKLTAINVAVQAYLDATVSSRLAAAGYTPAPTAAANADGVRTELSVELERLTKLAKLSAIDATLVVTPTSRTAGSVTQTIAEVGDTVTVTTL